MLLLVLVLLFIIFSIIINNYPTVTLWDRTLIVNIQDFLSDIPLWVPTLFDGILYAFMIITPLMVMWIFFAIKKKYFDIAYLGIVPLITYGLSSILKHIVERPRPPIEMHLSVHPGGFSYVSSHTVISFCLWSMIIYYLIKYCENKFLKYAGIFVAAVWMFLIGFSRVWLGVHNPSDVLAGYFFGIILLIIYINVRKFIEKYIGL